MLSVIATYAGSIALDLAWRASQRYSLNALLYSYFRNRRPTNNQASNDQQAVAINQQAAPAQAPTAYTYNNIDYFENTTTNTKHPLVNVSRLVIAFNSEAEANSFISDYKTQLRNNKKFGNAAKTPFRAIVEGKEDKFCVSFDADEMADLGEKLTTAVHELLRNKPVTQPENTTDLQATLAGYADKYRAELKAKGIVLNATTQEVLQFQVAERLDNHLSNIHLRRKAAKLLYWTLLSNYATKTEDLTLAHERAIIEIRLVFGDNFVKNIFEGGSFFGSHRTVTLMQELGIYDPAMYGYFGHNRCGFFGDSADTLKSTPRILRPLGNSNYRPPATNPSAPPPPGVMYIPATYQQQPPVPTTYQPVTGGGYPSLPHQDTAERTNRMK